MWQIWKIWLFFVLTQVDTCKLVLYSNYNFLGKKCEIELKEMEQVRVQDFKNYNCDQGFFYARSAKLKGSFCNATLKYKGVEEKLYEGLSKPVLNEKLEGIDVWSSPYEVVLDKKEAAENYELAYYRICNIERVDKAERVYNPKNLKYGYAMFMRRLYLFAYSSSPKKMTWCCEKRNIVHEKSCNQIERAISFKFKQEIIEYKKRYHDCTEKYPQNKKNGLLSCCEKSCLKLYMSCWNDEHCCTGICLKEVCSMQKKGEAGADNEDDEDGVLMKKWLFVTLVMSLVAASYFLRKYFPNKHYRRRVKID